MINQSYYWTLPKMGGVEFFKAHYTNFSYAPHFHEDYAIGVVEHGVHAFYYRGENFAVTPNYVVTCQPGEIHTGHPGNDLTWQFRMLYIQPEVMCEVASDLGYHTSTLPFIKQTIISHPTVIEAVRKFHQSADVGDSALSQDVQLRELLQVVLSHFSDIHLIPPTITDEKSPIQRAKTYMQSHYADDISLDDVAQVAHLSKSYFIRAFRKHEGISPYAYLVQVRLNRAKALLKSGLPVVDVAQRTGFFDQSHLIRYFKRFLGTTPGHYQTTIG